MKELTVEKAKQWEPLIAALIDGNLEYFDLGKGDWQAEVAIDFSLPIDVYRVKPPLTQGWVVDSPGTAYFYKKPDDIPIAFRNRSIFMKAAEPLESQIKEKEEKIAALIKLVQQI